MKFFLLLVCAACATAFTASAETIAIVNGRIVPVGQSPIERGTLIVTDGKIAAIGEKVAVPRGARRIDAAGLSVYPGWIDGWSTAGLSEIPSVSGTLDTTELGLFNPAAQAWIAVNPHSETLRTARVNGVTSALVAPAGGRVSGIASAMNLFGVYPDRMALLKNAGLVLNIPSLNRAPVQSISGPPETPDARRRRVAEDLEKLRRFLNEAKRYSGMRARTPNAPPDAIDSGFEAMLPAMRGERPVICTADHFRDIRSAIELGDEFGLKIVIAGGADAWKVADLLANKKIPVLFSGVNELPRTAEDPYDVGFSTPETLRRAGVQFAIVSGSAADVRNLPYRAAMAAAYGLEREDALKSITLWPAQILGVADKVGSLEPGKLANVLVSKGDPLDVRSEIRYVFIDGREVPPDNRNLQMYEQFRTTPLAP